MKLLFLTALCGALLSGCANNTPYPSAATDTPPMRVGAATQPAPVTPSTSWTAPSSTQGYQGNLSPIQPQTPDSATVASLQTPNDLWERMRKGFAMPDLDTPLVADRQQWYVAHAGDLSNMVERSRKYLFYIVEELERRGMPTELALLPFVESAYNPQAYSRAKAAGMWQFVPSTGKQYQLKQNAFRDDRRDVLASTRAALDYLERLHGMFGDWSLALAAYNWGEGSVNRAITKNTRLGNPTGYLDLNMPNETRYYVPKLLGLKNVVADPARFGVALPIIGNHPYFDSVPITRDIDVALAAKLAEVPLNDFKELNPSLHRPVILAAGTPQILLPWDNSQVFKRNLDSYSSDRLASWTVWIAPATLKPSEVAKRVNMSEAQLRQINGIPPNMVVRAGSSLVVPRPTQARDVTERIADNGQLALAPEMVLRKMQYRAGKRDNVNTIAHRFGVPAAKVAEWNRVNLKANFKPGQTIVVWRLVPAGSGGGSKLARR